MCDSHLSIKESGPKTLDFLSPGQESPIDLVCSLPYQLLSRSSKNQNIISYKLQLVTFSSFPIDFCLFTFLFSMTFFAHFYPFSSISLSPPVFEEWCGRGNRETNKTSDAFLSAPPQMWKQQFFPCTVELVKSHKSTLSHCSPEEF